MAEHVTQVRGDQHFCTRCGRCWDLGDVPPTECKPTTNEKEIGNQWIKKLKHSLS